jgi:arylsulfatase A-like enzyme
MALVVCKAWHIKPFYGWTLGNVERWMRDWLIVSGADALYALCFGVVGAGLLWVTRNRPKVQRRIWMGIVGLGGISVLYGVASVRMFSYLRRPLTYQLLYLANDPRSMWSSVAVFVTAGIVAAAVVVPLAYVCGAGWCERERRRNVLRESQIANCKYQIADLKLKLGGGILAVVVCGWYGWARHEVRSEWGAQHDERRLADNPQAAFVSSFFGGKVSFSSAFPDADSDDFKIVTERGPGAGRPTPGLRRGPKNVIVVICESVGAQHLSLYGSSFKTWPRIEAEAQNSLVFDNYYSHIANTANSLVSLTLSIYPDPLDWHEITLEHPHIPGQTAAGVLKGHGYRTAFISSGYNEFSNQQGFLQGRGFDVIEDARTLAKEPLNSWGAEDKYMVDGVLRFIDQERAKPFCVYSWTQGTHHPYGAEYGMDAKGWEIVDFKVDEGKWKGMSWDLNRYLNALKETDRQIGRLLDGLRQRGLADDTLVVITGDHGEAFGWPHESYGHSGKIYQEDVHVPMVLWNPVMFKNAGRSPVVGAHVDLSPTVLDILGVDLPPSWQGHSLLSPSHPRRAYFYGAMDDCLIGVREGKWKYLLNVSQGREELHNLEADPLEVTNSAAYEAGVCKELKGRLAAWVAYQRNLIR